MTAPVDVLAVLARHVSLADQVACREQQAEAHAVFDAIAELIEADKAYDYARRPNRPQNPHDLRETAERRAAALARVGGAP